VARPPAAQSGTISGSSVLGLRGAAGTETARRVLFTKNPKPLLSKPQISKDK
jgi:hypothetical protein